MALSGMTGFGRADGAHGAWTWTVEARSVNGRSLEARFRGPSGFDSLERAARDAAQGRFQRGQITIGLQAKRADAAGAVRVNLEQLERYLDATARYVTEGRATATLLPCVRNSSGAPTPDNIKAVGEVIAPHDRTTSLSA